MLIHYKDPSFLEKKDYYQKLVENLDYKNNKYLYLNSDSSNKNNSFIFTTKDESQNNSTIISKLKSNSIDSDENINKNNKCFDEDKEKDFDEIEEKSQEKNFNNDNLFYDMINKLKNKNNINNISNIYILGNINYEIEKENDDKEENSLYIQEIKNENNNIFHFEDIL